MGTCVVNMITDTTVTANFTISIYVPILVSPANGANLLNRRPVLDWLDVTGGTRYDIQVARNTAFTLGLIRYTATTSTYTPSSDLLANMNFYWRVRS